MNIHDKYNPVLTILNKTDNAHQPKTAKEVSSQIELKSSNDTSMPRWEQARIILPSMMHNKNEILKEMIANFACHHCGSSLEIYFDAIVRNKK